MFLFLFLFSNTAKAEVSELILLPLSHTCDKQHNKLVLTKQSSSLKSKLREKDQIVKEDFHLCTFCCFALLVEAILTISLPMVGMPFFNYFTHSEMVNSNFLLQSKSILFIWIFFVTQNKSVKFSFVARARFPFHTLNAAEEFECHCSDKTAFVWVSLQVVVTFLSVDLNPLT